MTEETDKTKRPLTSDWLPSTRIQLFYCTLIALAMLGLAWLYAVGTLKLKTSAALYIGLPVFLAYAVVQIGPLRSALRECLRAAVIVMLLAVPVFQEGFVCIIMAAPLILGVAALAGALIDFVSRHVAARREQRLRSALLLVPLGLLALEGTHPALTFERFNEVQASAVVAASSADIERRLDNGPRFTAPVPWLAAVFPAPSGSEGGGLQAGDEHSVEFVYARHIWFNHHRGKVVYRVDWRDEHCVHFTAVRDSSYLSAYLRWRGSQVCWETIDADATLMSWRIGYERKLDPAWYFGPLQRFYVQLVASHLVDNLRLATPPAR